MYLTDPISDREFDKARGIVLISILLRKLTVYFNCLTGGLKGIDVHAGKLKK